MRKIKMTKTALGADDGHTVIEYQAGEEYEVGESLRKAFVDDMGVAKDVKAPAKKKAPESKKG